MVDLVYNKVRSADRNKETQILKDSSLKPNNFDKDLSRDFASNCNKPDICLIDHENRKCKLVEVSIPFDSHIDLTYRKKFEKYFPLSLEVNELGFQTEIIILIIGSLGNVHHKFQTGLKHIGLCNTEAKYLAKYCSISAIIGSKNIWNLRCRDFHRI